MSDFNRGKRPGGRSFGGGNRGGFGGGRSFGGGRDGGRSQMYKATCSECGKECEIPFRPSGDRPVFCSTCFEKQGGGGDRPNKFGGERRERPRFEDKQMHDAICAKCGAKCQVPFRPMPGKDVFCDACFGKNVPVAPGVKSGDNYKQQFEIINAKLDKILQSLTSGVGMKEIKEVKKVKKEVVKTKAPAKKLIKKKK